MLKAAIRSLEEVEEGQRSLYRQEGEIFVLNVEGALGWGNENIEGLKGTLGKLRADKSSLEDRLKPYDGLDATAARDALKKVEEFTAIDPKKEADRIAQEKINAQVGQIKSMYEGEKKTLTDRLDRFKGQLVALGVDAEIDRALNGLEASGHKISPPVRGDLRVVLRQYVGHEFDDDKGSLRVTVHDGQGVPRVKNTAGDLMSIADLVAELPTSRPNFFEPKGNNGAGAKPGSGGNPPSTKKRSEMSVQDKAAFVREHGQEAFLKLPA
jgi:hypothetical protein